MYPKLKLYLLFIPYIVSILFVPDVYGMKDEVLLPSIGVFAAISLITSFLYCCRFFKLYNNKKWTWHSLGHLLFFGILSFSSSIIYSEIHYRSGLEGLAAGLFVMIYWWIASPILISIILCATILFLKSLHARKDSILSTKREQNSPWMQGEQ